MSMLYEILECTYIFVLESVSCSAVPGSLGPHGVQSTRLLSMEFSRQEYWSGQPFPSAGDLPNPGIESGSPALLADSLLSEPLGKPQPITTIYHKLGGLKQTNKQTKRNLFSHSSGGLESDIKVLVGPHSLQSLWRESLLASSRSGGSPFLYSCLAPVFCLHSHGFSLFVHAFFPSVSCKDTCHLIQGLLWHSRMIPSHPFSKLGHTDRFWIQMSQGKDEFTHYNIQNHVRV